MQQKLIYMYVLQNLKKVIVIYYNTLAFYIKFPSYASYFKKSKIQKAKKFNLFLGILLIISNIIF